MRLNILFTHSTSGVEDFVLCLSSFSISLVVICTLMSWLKGSLRFYGSGSCRKYTLKGTCWCVEDRWGVILAWGQVNSLAWWVGLAMKEMGVGGNCIWPLIVVVIFVVLWGAKWVGEGFNVIICVDGGVVWQTIQELAALDFMGVISQYILQPRNVWHPLSRSIPKISEMFN